MQHLTQSGDDWEDDTPHVPPIRKIMRAMILIVLRQQYDALLSEGLPEIASFVAGAIMRLEALEREHASN